MADTLTRYLKLKVADDLSADAKYNLQRIDALGATTITDSNDTLQLRSRGNVTVEAQSPDIGGSGQNGTIRLGTLSSKAAVEGYTTSFNIRSALSLLSSTNDANKISLAVGSTQSGAATISFLAAGNATLTIPAVTDTVVTLDAVQTLTNKIISGIFTGSLTGNVTGTLTGNVVGNVSGTASNITDTSNSTITSLPSLSLPGSQVSGNIPGNSTNITGTLAIANGGTGATTVTAARINLLPSYTGNALGLLRINSAGTDLEWVLGAGQGTVTQVTASSPLSITGNATVSPNVEISQATSSISGYLSSTDWSTFNAKEPAITSGTTGQYWRGDKSWQTLDKSAVGLGSVDNTSDTNKPISSATQSALNAKYDASNPSNYVDASGAKTAAVVNSTAGSETDQAPSVSAIKSYISSVAGGSTSYSWLTSDGATKSITHSLNKDTVSVSIYDENGEDILIDSVDRTSNNAVTLTSSVAPTGTWTVIIRP